MNDTEKNRPKSNNLRKRAETFLQKTPSAIKKMSGKDFQGVKDLMEELQIHQVELEMQGDELRRSQMELEEARDRYLDLYDFAPVGYFTISKKGIILEVNLTATTLLGVVRSALLGTPFSRFITQKDQDLFYSHKRKLLESRERETCELRLVKKDGREFYAKLESICVGNSEGDSSEFRISISDIDKQKKAVEALIKNEQKYRLFVETANEGLWAIDAKHQTTFVNRRMSQILGFTFREMIGQPVESFMFVDDLPDHKAEMEQRKQGCVSTYERRFRSKDGREVWTQVSATPIIDPEGRFAGSHALFTDITDSRRAQKALQESEKRYESLIERIQVAIVVHNAQTEIIIGNSKAQELLGITEDQMLGKMAMDPEWKFLNANGKTMSLEEYPVNQVLATRQPLKDFTAGVYRPGKDDVVWVLVNADPVLDYDGEIQQVIVTFVDITERRKAEKALQEASQFKDMIISESPVGIVIYDAVSGQCIACNDAVAALVGATKEQLLAQNFHKINSWKKSGLLQTAMTALENNEKKRHTAKVKSTFGKELAVDCNFAPLFFGNKRYLLLMASDITKQKKAESEKEILEAQLRQSQKLESIGTLAGGIAHDFNNILSAVIGYTELSLDDAERSSNMEGNLQEILTAGKRAKDLVKQILTFARQRDEELKPLQVDIILKEVLKFLRSSIPTTIKIKQDIKSDSLIMGNTTQVHQVLMNLCINASQAMEVEGGILEVSLKDIRIERTSSLPELNLKPGNYIRIRVSDTGIGIPQEIITSIFDPYFTTKEPGEGTGMGLATAHGIVETYGGRITVDSTLGKGTLFTIYLPVVKKRKEHHSYQSEELPSGTERVLFVDDEAPIVNMCRQILSRLGYSVSTRTSSVEALELFRSKPEEFDLVITDMTMPNMTGDRLTVALMEIRPEIPVILCTGYSKKISDENVADMGIRAFVYKPVVKADLAKTVRRVLDEAKGE